MSCKRWVKVSRFFALERVLTVTPNVNSGLTKPKDDFCVRTASNYYYILRALWRSCQNPGKNLIPCVRNADFTEPNYLETLGPVGQFLLKN